MILVAPLIVLQYFIRLKLDIEGSKAQGGLLLIVIFTTIAWVVSVGYNIPSVILLPALKKPFPLFFMITATILLGVYGNFDISKIVEGGKNKIHKLKRHCVKKD